MIRPWFSDACYCTDCSTTFDSLIYVDCTITHAASFNDTLDFVTWRISNLFQLLLWFTTSHGSHNINIQCYTDTHTHTQLFYGSLDSGTTRVSRYQKKHSPTYTYRGHQSSLICFLHLCFLLPHTSLLLYPSCCLTKVWSVSMWKKIVISDNYTRKSYWP